jgi:hypothetical protein
MINPKPLKFIPKTPADALALEIAKAFNDEVRLPLYRQICSAHEQSIVFRAFRIALRTPLSKIKKSRRAFLIFLLRKYDSET